MIGYPEWPRIVSPDDLNLSQVASMLIMMNHPPEAPTIIASINVLPSQVKTRKASKPTTISFLRAVALLCLHCGLMVNGGLILTSLSVAASVEVGMAVMGSERDNATGRWSDVDINGKEV